MLQKLFRILFLACICRNSKYTPIGKEKLRKSGTLNGFIEKEY